MFAHTLCLWLLAAGLADGISLRRGEYRLKVPVLDLSDAFSDVRRTFSGASIDIRLGKDKEEDDDNYDQDVYYSNFAYPLPSYPAWPPYPIHPPPTRTPTTSTTPRISTSAIPSTSSPTNDTRSVSPPRAHLHEDPPDSQQTVPRRRVITYLIVPSRKFKIVELTPDPAPVY